MKAESLNNNLPNVEVTRQKIYDKAIKYRKAGLDIIPVHPKEKYPCGYSDWQTRSFTDEILHTKILDEGWGIGIRNLEILDFDNHGEPNAETVFTQWEALVESISPGLTKKLTVEKTQHKGFHVGWRCEKRERNKKIARRKPTAKELEKDQKLREITFIETRGVGGQFVCDPTPGYYLVKNDWASVSIITPEERRIFLQCASTFDQLPKKIHDYPKKEKQPTTTTGDRPGDLCLTHKS